MVHRSFAKSEMWCQANSAVSIVYSQWWSQRFMQVVWKVTSAWCGVEDQQWKENDKKAQIGGHREVSDEQAHQHDISLIADQILESHKSGLGRAVHG